MSTFWKGFIAGISWALPAFFFGRLTVLWWADKEIQKIRDILNGRS